MIVVFLWLGCAVATGLIAGWKHRSSIGWGILGVIFGPLALLGIAVVSVDRDRQRQFDLATGKMRRCPACAEPVLNAATVCRYCGAALPPAPKVYLFGRRVS